MTTAQYLTLAVKAARLAATSTTQAEANRWWAEVERYEALAEAAA
jgi:hypothetical protein